MEVDSLFGHTVAATSPVSSSSHGTLEKQHLPAVLEHYAALSSNSSTEMMRAQLQELQCHVQGQGLHGDRALDLLRLMRSEWQWETMDSARFAVVYRFAFWICRDAGKRNMPVDRAVAAWHLMLNGRFRLLERWLTFIRDESGVMTISEDTWRQVLDFTRCILGDMSNYDLTGAWPVLLDEFVEKLRKGRSSSFQKNLHSLADGPAAPNSDAMVAVSPTAGCKRRAVDVDGVAAMLSQMPFGNGVGAENCAVGPCGGAKKRCVGFAGGGEVVNVTGCGGSGPEGLEGGTGGGQGSHLFQAWSRATSGMQPCGRDFNCFPCATDGEKGAHVSPSARSAAGVHQILHATVLEGLGFDT